MNLLPKNLTSVQSRRKLAKKIYKNGEELAQNVEILVERLVKGHLFETVSLNELTIQVASNLDRYVSGFIGFVLFAF